MATVGKQVLTSKCHSGAAALTAVKGSLVKTELSIGLFAVTRLALMPMAIEIARFNILKSEMIKSSMVKECAAKGVL